MGRLLTGLALLLVGLGAIARGQDLARYEQEVIELVEKVSPSVVQVHAVAPGPFTRPHPVTASGVVLDGEGTIATLGTAVAGCEEVTVELSDGRRRKARVLGVDERSNVGILSAEPEGLVPIEPAPSEGLRVGAFALSVGNPLGLRSTVGTGLISGLHREVQGLGLVDGRPVPVIFYDLVQTTAPVNPGDSGGLLADSRGRMIGMLSATFGRAPSAERIRQMIRGFLRNLDLTRVRAFLDGLGLTEEQRVVAEFLLGRLEQMQESMADEPAAEAEAAPTERAGASLGAESINFALPAEQVWYAARMIRAHGRMIRLGLTASVPDESLVSLVGRRGLLVERVDENGPAGRAELGPNDLLVEFGGHPVESLLDLRRALVASPVKGRIPVVVIRQGAAREVFVTFE